VLNRLTFATTITAAKIAFRNSGGVQSQNGHSAARGRQSEEGHGEDSTARAVQFENVLDH
jgi:hypothetical protein